MPPICEFEHVLDGAAGFLDRIEEPLGALGKAVASFSQPQFCRNASEGVMEELERARPSQGKLSLIAQMPRVDAICKSKR